MMNLPSCSKYVFVFFVLQGLVSTSQGQEPSMPSQKTKIPSFAPTVAKFIDTDEITNGTFIYTASFSVDIRAQYPRHNVTVCDPTEWNDILMVSEHCLNTHYFDAVPEGVQNVTFVMDGFDRSLFVDRTNKTFSNEDLQFLANNKSYTKRLESPPVLKERVLSFTIHDDDKSKQDQEVKVVIPPTRVYEVDNTTDCEYRSHVNMCRGPSDVCMLACGKAIPISLRSDVNGTELANNTEAITNSKFLPISQWQSLRKHLGMCLRGYVEYTGTKCLGYKDKLVVEMDVFLDVWDPNATSSKTATEAEVDVKAE